MMKIYNDELNIRKALKKVLGDVNCICVERMGGLTNRTYKIELESGEIYVVRIPGEGTEELICRADEKVSTQLACELGIDAPMLYFGEDGTKVTKYISGAQTLTADKLRQKEIIIQIARIFNTLHCSSCNTGVPFEVFDMALSYEKIIQNNHVVLYEDYFLIKDKVMQIKAHVEREGEVKKVPCHNDSLCGNWVLSDKGQLFLIDWEYAGMNDAMWDLADISIEAEYSEKDDSFLLREYFGRAPLRDEIERFEANKIYLDFLWTLWGKARVPFDGESMEQYALERYIRLKRNVEKFWVS